MKHFVTRWLPRTEAGNWALGVACFCLLLSAPGCVTRATYNEDVGRLEEDNKRLEGRVESLTRTNSSLDEERVRLAELR